MKKYPNLSKYFHVDISILLCLIYVINYAFSSIEIVPESEAVRDHDIALFEIFRDFFVDIIWYLFFYIFLDVTCKALSLIELIAKIIGKPLKINIKLLHEYCTLLLLILVGKFLVFLIASIF